ncbi:MAG: hypothetical protein JXB39_02740 [Deltaproteobacteria bacterium]|nr:hypothetical protein [Deltaproteobacteria bacterium]
MTTDALGAGSFVSAPPRPGPGRALLLFLVLGLTGLVWVLEADVVALAVCVATSGLLVGWMILGPRRLRYEVVQGHLVVRTVLATRRFALSGRSARRTGVHARLRLAGTGIPGYHTGWFLLDVGATRAYATRFDDGVLLEGKPRVFVSPADPEALLAALRARGVRDGV